METDLAKLVNDFIGDSVEREVWLRNRAQLGSITLHRIRKSQYSPSQRVWEGITMAIKAYHSSGDEHDLESQT